MRHLRSVIADVAVGLGVFDSPWQRVPFEVPKTAFGAGSQRDFADYFQGESLVAVTSIDDITEWLRQCEYARDLDLFNERDLWQHPSAFERLRRGDCEDFALWAWRKLAEIGVDAEFYVGRVIDPEGASSGQHAWVVYRIDDRELLFEPAARERSRMVRRLDDVKHQYVPHFAIDHNLRTWAFAGCALDSAGAPESLASDLTPSERRAQ